MDTFKFMPLAVAAFLTACGGSGVSPNINPPSGSTSKIDIADVNFVKAEIDRMRPTFEAEQRFNGTSRFDGYVSLPSYFTDGYAIGELITQVDFGNQRVSMTTGDFIALDNATRRFQENISGGLTMSDGQFTNVNGALAFTGTLRGNVKGGSISANIGANFWGQGGSAIAFEGSSLSGSTHEVIVRGLN